MMAHTLANGILVQKAAEIETSYVRNTLAASGPAGQTCLPDNRTRTYGRARNQGRTTALGPGVSSRDGTTPRNNEARGELGEEGPAQHDSS